MGIGVRIAMGVAIAGGIAACGIEIPDVMPDTDGGGAESGADVTNSDASDAGSMDALADVIVPPSCDGGCGVNLPLGFGLVLYAANRNTPCTSGQVVSDLIADPSVASNACSCGCTTTGKGDCSSGQLGFWLDSTGDGSVCSKPSGLILNPPGPACQVLNNVTGFASFHSLDAAAPVDAGGCQLTGVANINQVVSTDVRVCVPTSCSDGICGPQNGLRLCAISNGDVACPSGFGEKHTLATSASVSCGCNGTCTPSTSCAGVVTFYTDSLCAQLDFALSSDAGCAPNPTATPGSYKYVGTPNTTCTANGAPSSNLMVVGTRTLCCKP